ncbi:MAG: hypothetical protein AB1805_10425 [Nitrospirota bacterium]
MRVENIPYPRQVISVSRENTLRVEPIAVERKADFPLDPYLPEVRPEMRPAARSSAPGGHFPLVEIQDGSDSPALYEAPQPLPYLIEAEVLAEEIPPPSATGYGQMARERYAVEEPAPEPIVSIYV